MAVRYQSSRHHTAGYVNTRGTICLLWGGRWIFNINHLDELHISYGRAMAQAVSRPPVTAAGPGFDAGSVHLQFLVDEVALGQVILRRILFSLL